MQRPQGEGGSGREGTDGACNDVVAPLGSERGGSRGDQRVARQSKADHRQGEDEGKRQSRVGSARNSRGEGTNGVANDRVPPPGAEGEGCEGEQRVAPQRDDDHQQGEEEGGQESILGSEKVNRVQGIRGRPAIVERQQLTVYRKRSRSDRIEPAHTDPDDEGRKGGSREKGWHRKSRLWWQRLRRQWRKDGGRQQQENG